MSTLPRVVLLGPTAVGKTETAVHLARLLGAEIISADSMQLYRGLDIGTAKPGPGIRREIVHHLVDCVDPMETYDVSRFIQDAETAARQIEARHHPVLITGGTGLYLRAWLQGLLQDDHPDRELCRALEEEARREGILALRAELKISDPKKYVKLPPGDIRRIVRAVVYHRLHGRPLSEDQNHWQGEAFRGVVLLGLELDRAVLYERINRRVATMMEAGLLQEVEVLRERGVPREATCWQAIGYRQLADYLDGRVALDEAVRRIQRDSRRLAKRQLTWFKKMPSIDWFPSGDPEAVSRKLHHRLCHIHCGFKLVST